MGGGKSKIGPTRITRIVVHQLFGDFDYVLPSDGRDVSELMILYGGNGTGKTTILNLLFALLVSRHKAGAKTSIARTPFRDFRVEFDDGTVVSMWRAQDSLIGSYEISIHRPEGGDFSILVTTEPDDPTTVGKNFDIDVLFREMAKLDLTLFLLPDDRRVTASGSDISDADAYEVFETIDGQRIVRRHKRAEQTHHLDLTPVLRAVFETTRQEALQGSTQGDESASSIYEGVITRIANLTPFSSSAPPQPLPDLLRRIEVVGRRTEEFGKYGLISPISMPRLIETISRTSGGAQATIGIVLAPYVEGLEAKLAALQGIKTRMARLVDTVNRFFAPKSISFSIQNGIRVADRRGMQLNPNVLSSGEKQLLLLFCNCFHATSRPSIFLIDEPELSLNIAWQRHLLDALTGFSADGGAQFVLATHSLELLAKHRPNTVRLQDVRDVSSP